MAKSLRSKEYDRITQQIRRAERRGYIFDVDYKKSLKQMSYEELKSQRVKDVYGSGYVVDQSTGEIIQGDIAREIEKDIQREKAKSRYVDKDSSRVLPEYREAFVYGWLASFEGLNQNRAVGARFVIDRVHQMIDTYGIDTVAEALAEFEENNLISIASVGYDKEKAAAVMAGLQNILWEKTHATNDEIKAEQEQITGFNDDISTAFDDYRFYDGEEDE